MEQFTPISALVGGLLIGLAATLLMILNGRIAGISGIVGGLLEPRAGDTLWRASFAVGLVLGALAFAAGGGSLDIVHVEAGWPIAILGGILVGVGTHRGRGCTSGHGVCGVARLSWRSIVATLTFMAAGIATVSVVRHAIGG